MTTPSTHHTVHAAVLLTILLFVSGCAGCEHPEDASPAAKAEKGAAPTALVPRSHQLTEMSGARMTPLTTLQITPIVGRKRAEGSSAPLWVSAAGEPDSGGVPLTVVFTAEVQGGPPDLQYRWDFGDTSAPAYQLNVQHTYRAAGEYTAVLTVSGGDAEESDEVYVQVSEEGIDVSIDADPDIGRAPLTVHLSAVVDDDEPSGPFQYQWDFGDGERAASNPTTHTYREPGQYTATCVVTNAQGQLGHEEVEIQVDALDEDADAQ